MSVDVWITGIGACTATGRTARELWENAIRPQPDSPEPGRSPDPAGQAGLLTERAVTEAMTDAGLWDGSDLVGVDPSRLGSTFSASKPFFEEGKGLVLPAEVVHERVGQQFRLHGESRNIIAACATGAYAAALGASWIQHGLCDVVLVGSVEPYPHELIEAGFRRMGVMSQEPVMRPFDRHRTGFVLSYGAGAIVLESKKHAKKRGAPAKARLTGWGLGADGHSPVAFNANGQRIAQVIRQALSRASLRPTAIQHINAHGTATPLNDWIETQALMKAFEDHAPNLMISATKSSTGHLLGAAGSVELVLTVQTLKEQFIPPTTYLEIPDPDCPLDYTPRQGHSAKFDHAISLSFGFGGPIGALVVSRS